MVWICMDVENNEECDATFRIDVKDTEECDILVWVWTDVNKTLKIGLIRHFGTDALYVECAWNFVIFLSIYVLSFLSCQNFFTI